MQTSSFILMGDCFHHSWQWHHRSLAKQHITRFSSMKIDFIYQEAAVINHLTGDVQSEARLQ